MSGGNYATFADEASIIVLAASVGLLLGVQGIAWAFGYRKAFADEARVHKPWFRIATRIMGHVDRSGS